MVKHTQKWSQYFFTSNFTSSVLFALHKRVLLRLNQTEAKELDAVYVLKHQSKIIQSQLV